MTVMGEIYLHQNEQMNKVITSKIEREKFEKYTKQGKGTYFG